MVAPTAAKKVIRARKPATVSPSASSTATDISEQDIAALAYKYWQARGCPDGSAEEDWFRAERELHCRS
jgi:DUF2934 family protein